MSGSPPPTGGFVRRIGLFQATAINMSQMCGIGPFVTIPLMVGAFGGPQAVIGFVAGAVLALADGLVWAELGASMPGSGGSYVYLRQAFQYRSGRLMPFLFVWTAMLFIPLIMSTGVVGFVQYLGYLAPHMGRTTGDLIGLGMILVVIMLLWRGIEHIARITAVMWAVMIASVLLVIVAAATDFSAAPGLHLPGARLRRSPAATSGPGFAAGLTIGIYDYLGYNTTAYMGAEIKDPGRVLPRSIIYSILGIMAIYLLLQIGTLGVIDWHRMTDPNDIASTSVASAVLEKTWGKGAADTVTVLILITAFASVFTGLLGGSRVPVRRRPRTGLLPAVRQAARRGTASRCWGLATMGVITAIGFLIGRHTDLATLIQLLTTVMVIVQALAQIARRDGAAQPPAGPAPPVQDVAVPGAQPGRPGRLARHLRLRGQELARPPPHRMVAGLARARHRRVRCCGRASRRSGRSGRRRSPRSTSTAPIRTRSPRRRETGRAYGRPPGWQARTGSVPGRPPRMHAL